MFHILFDDIRNLNGMDIIIRTPPAMLEFIDSFDTTGHFIYMDNDLGDFELEGRHILFNILDDGQRPAHVYLVTSNVVARINMTRQLLSYGYHQCVDGLEFIWPKEPQ